jgi:NADH:ubiquinone oxidoreductase subunit 6 (subunit J)
MVVVVRHSVFSLLFLIASFIFSTFLLFLLESEFLALLFIIGVTINSSAYLIERLHSKNTVISVLKE